MRYLLFLGLLLSTFHAQAESRVVGLICEVKPTKTCVLDLAVAAALAAPPEPDTTLPFARIVETAAKAGRLDVALALADRLRPDGDIIAAADLVYAFTRAGRLAELDEWLAARGETRGHYAAWIVPVLVEFGREAEIEPVLGQREPLPPALKANFYALGHLRAGRADEALKMVGGIEDLNDRVSVAGAIVETLISSGDAEKALAVLPLLTGTDAYVLSRKAKLANARSDAALAREILPAFSRLSADDRRFIVRDVAAALVKGGAWREAVPLAEGETGEERALVLVDIAAYSAEPEAFALIEQAIEAEPDALARERLTRMLVSALVRAGYAPVAGQYVSAAASDYERENLLTFAAASLAERRNGAEALQIVRSITDPHRKAWALWEVADKLKP